MNDRSSPTSPDRPAESAASPPATGGMDWAELVAEFATAGELERRRVAESIHDDSIQAIAALGMRLQMLRRAITDADQLTMLTEAEKAVQLSVARLRLVVFELQPPGLEQEGLSVALAIALDSERDSAAVYRLDDQLSTQPAPAQSALLFRIAQEALANVREHARASNVDVVLYERDGGHAVRIADDGVGCRPEQAAPGYGFASMHMRARIAGGAVSVESGPAGGTTVEAWLPRTPTPEGEGEVS
jgi:signal transduction histidine kinase